MGIDETLIDQKRDKMVPKDERALYIDNLVPKTVYSFNISAKFIDGLWGPPYHLRFETSIDGQSLSGT